MCDSVKRNCLGIVLSLFAGTCLATPSITCTEATWDFGVLSATNNIEHIYAIKNAGDAPLLIEELRGCCGASMALSSSNITPGTAAELKVIISLAGRTGTVNKGLYIKSNDPQQTHFQIRVVGSIADAGASNLQYQVHTYLRRGCSGLLGDKPNVTLAANDENPQVQLAAK